MCRSTGLCLLILVTIIPFITGQCQFPSDWKTSWFYQRVGGLVYYQSISDSSIDYYTVASPQQPTLISSGACTDGAPSFPFYYHVHQVANAAPKCIAGFKSSSVILAAETQNQANTQANVCGPQALAQETSRAVYLKYPIVENNQVRCPIPDGTYQVDFALTSSSSRQCVGDQTSIVIVLGNTMTISSCYTASHGYDKPLWVLLLCEDTFSSNAAGAATSSDHFLILREPIGNDLYCTRYRTVGHQVHISFDVSSEEKTVCQLSADATTLDAAGNYVQLKLTRNDCEIGACNNGNCTQLLNGFYCNCFPGWSGAVCNENLDECLSSPCVNGLCVDEENSYRCICEEPGTTGVNCEISTCTLPVEYFSSAGWFTGYDAAYSMESIVFNNEESQRFPSGKTQQCRRSWDVDGDGDTYVLWHDSSSGRYTCGKITLKGSVMLYREAKNDSSAVEISEDACRGIFDDTDNTVPIQVYTKRPIADSIPGSGSADLIDGAYQMTFRQASDEPIECEFLLTSEATISGGGGRIAVASCFDEQEAYDQPFADKELVVVESFSEDEVDGGDTGRGAVIILAYDPSNSSVVFYCTRVETTESRIFLSLNVQSDKSPVCNPLSDAATADASPNNHQAIILSSVLCRTDAPCLNGATCIDKLGYYECICATGFSGRECQHDTDDCANVVCFNGGTCEDEVAGYRCECMPGYSGSQCQDYDDCFTQPCVNGLCYDIGTTYSCICSSGFTGSRCDIEVNECDSDPCENGGMCVDGNDSYLCLCLSGSTGLNCETNFDDCASDPCQNGGNCEDKLNGYYCRCTDEWTGVHCEHYDECSSNPCQNDGICHDNYQSYWCECPPGYSGPNCEVDPGPCWSEPCANGGDCTEDTSTGSYTCSCLPGFRGDDCRERLVCTPDLCENGGTCAVAGEQAVCLCRLGYGGPTCNYRVIPKDNPCLPNPCENEGTCRVSGLRSYVCSCPPEFIGHRCQYKHQCYPNPCPGNEVCEPRGSDGFLCLAPEEPTRLSKLSIILISIAVVAFIICIVVTLCYCFLSKGGAEKRKNLGY